MSGRAAISRRGFLGGASTLGAAVLLPVLQRRFVAGLTATGLKG